MKREWPSIRDRWKRLPARSRLAVRSLHLQRVGGRLWDDDVGHVMLWSSRLAIGQRRDSSDTTNALFLDADLKPTDERSRYLLDRDVNNHRCVLECRLRPEPFPPDYRPGDDAAEWEALLNADPACALLPRLGPQGYSSLDLDCFDGTRVPISGRGASPRCSPTRQLATVPDSVWHRWIRARLALFFGRPARSDEIRALVRYYTRPFVFTRWYADPDLRPLVLQCDSDAQLDRLIGVLNGIARLRSQLRAGDEELNRDWIFTFRFSGIAYRFRFGSLFTHHGTVHERAKSVHLILHYVRDSLYYYDPGNRALAAAAVFLGREFLDAPRSLKNRRTELTQEAVARRFRTTRSRVRDAVKTARSESFQSMVFEANRRAARASRLNEAT